PKEVLMTNKVRRSMLLCCHFARNAAYYRAGWDKGQLLVSSQFWVNTNSNCFDLAVMEWCKLFGSKRDKHHWSKVLSDEIGFEKELESLIPTAIEDPRLCMKAYRDKFVAHLDLENTIKLPSLDVPLESTFRLYGHLFNLTLGTSWRGNLPVDLRIYYEHCFKVAKSAYVSVT
ncbi:hypothetical protein DMW00_25330, partial [Vibrio parahaemolyticus]|nr:hypothetical protein [Vibrio parahaemolyticus]